MTGFFQGKEESLNELRFEAVIVGKNNIQGWLLSPASLLAAFDTLAGGFTTLSTLERAICRDGSDGIEKERAIQKDTSENPLAASSPEILPPKSK